MIDQVLHFAQTPRLQLVFGGEKPADVKVEEGETEIHQYEGEEETGHPQADEPDKGEDVVADGVLAHGRVDANRQGDGPGQNNRAQREHHSHGEAVADHVEHRLAPHHRGAEIALEDAAHPFEVLLVHRPVERVLAAQGLEMLFGDVGLSSRQLGHVGVDKVAGRQLDDDEREHRDRPQREDSQNESTGDVGKHARLRWSVASGQRLSSGH